MLQEEIAKLLAEMAEMQRAVEAGEQVRKEKEDLVRRALVDAQSRDKEREDMVPSTCVGRYNTNRSLACKARRRKGSDEAAISCKGSGIATGTRFSYLIEIHSLEALGRECSGPRQCN